MTFYPDLGTKSGVDSGPYVRAVGWLDGEHPFARANSSPEFISALRNHVSNAWRPIVLRGKHICELCGSAWAGGNVWIPAEDVVYVAPELIVHYVEAHAYKPPDAFVQAVLACPEQRSSEYFALMRRFPAYWAEYLPPA